MVSYCVRCASTFFPSGSNVKILDIETEGFSNFESLNLNYALERVGTRRIKFDDGHITAILNKGM